MRRLLLAATAVAATLSSAVAQQDKYVGQWNCQIANQTISNNRFENYMFSFGMSLQSNGSFRAQGMYWAETNGFNDPFNAQGQWQAFDEGITGNGQAFKQTGNLPFVFAFRYHGPGSMTYRTQTANGQLAMACTR